MLLAGLSVLLWRYTGGEEVRVGTVVAGRPRSELEGLVGFFVNTLVMRVGVRGEERWSELLGRVREEVLGALGHQEVPFERLVEELRPERDASRTPLFQVLLVVQNVLGAVPRMEGLRVEEFAVPRAPAMFDLGFDVSDRPDTLLLRLGYDASLFDRETVRRLARHFRAVLEHLVRHPDLPVAACGLLDPEERRQLLEGWNPPLRPRLLHWSTWPPPGSDNRLPRRGPLCANFRPS